MANKPTEEMNEFLDKALAHVKSVPYKPSLRWLFYRLLQDGLLSDKARYKSFTFNLSKYRKRFYRGWRPDTVVDDTRQIDWYGVGFMDKEDWVDSLSCILDKFKNQDYFVMIWFEAQAMIHQFKYYTEHIPLVAFKGDPSLYYKHKLSKAIESAADDYNKPIVILYFGDCDKKGKQIPESALRDIRKWCDTEFEFIHCGLTLEQAKKLNLPENPEKPGEYQWEALTDEQAKGIIEPYVKKYFKEVRVKEIEEKEEDILEEVKEKLIGVDTKCK